MQEDSTALLNRQTVTRAATGDYQRYALTMAITRFRRHEAVQLALSTHASPRVVEAIKGAQTSMSSSGSALAPYAPMAEGFAQSLVPFAVFDRLLNDGSFMVVPLRTDLAIYASGANGHEISEAAAKPPSAMAFESAPAVFSQTKISAWVVVNEELARFMSAASMNRIFDELRREVARETDTILLNALAAPGIPSHASTGDFARDLETAAQSVSLGANSRPVLILPPAFCAALALQRGPSGPVWPGLGVTGGTVAGITWLISDAAATSNAAYYFDATQVAAATEPIVLTPADQASVQVDDSPTSGAHSLVNLWQTNRVALRVERTLGVEVLRTTAAATISGVGTTV
jgi:hypothetical protein